MSELISSLKRTPYQTSAAFLVLLFALLLSGILFTSLSFLYGLLHYVETRPQVIVYFQPKTTESDIFKIRDDIMSSGKVASTKYVTKQDAYKIYKDIAKDNPLLLEMTSADVLPASLEIYAKKPEFLPQLADYLGKQPGVDEVQFQKNIVDKLLTLTSVVRKATLILFSYLILMTIIVLITTTTFKIALKKDEIEVLQLLGASKWYIKKPFIQESMFLGLMAAVVATLFITGMIYSMNSFLISYLKGIPQLSIEIASMPILVWPFNVTFLLITFGLIALFGIVIAFIASFFGTDKYLGT